MMKQNEPETRQESMPANSNDPTSSLQTPAKGISPAKLAANRRNGTKSKGPVTAEGKARSRWNALKHGVLSARLMVFKDGEGETFEMLLENLRRDLSPANTLEEILTEKIAIAYWRLHIAYGYEADSSRTRERFIASVDRIGRYATSIHRQLLQDMTQLERVQRFRNGEAVQPPISIDVNVNGLEGSGLSADDEDCSRLIVIQSDDSKLLEAASPVRAVIAAEALPQKRKQAEPQLELCETNPRLETSGGEEPAGDAPEDQRAQIANQ
jgi:hypothetical protein